MLSRCRTVAPLWHTFRRLKDAFQIGDRLTHPGESESPSLAAGLPTIRNISSGRQQPCASGDAEWTEAVKREEAGRRGLGLDLGTEEIAQEEAAAHRVVVVGVVAGEEAAAVPVVGQAVGELAVDRVVEAGVGVGRRGGVAGVGL